MAEQTSPLYMAAVQNRLNDLANDIAIWTVNLNQANINAQPANLQDDTQVQADGTVFVAQCHLTAVQSEIVALTAGI
jgi:hypothetical protein